MLKELCQYIVESGNLDDLVIGESLFAGSIPQTAPNDCTVIAERVGPVVNDYLKDRRDIRLQILTTGTTYFSARDECTRIFEWLCARANSYGIDLTSWYINVTTNAIGPAYIGQDEKFRYQFSANLTFKVNKKG